MTNLLKMYQVGIFSMFLIAFVWANKIPENFKPYRCRLDKDLNRCIMKNANEVIPFLARGVPELQIAPLDPLEIEFMKLIDTPTLHLNFSKISIYGLCGLQMITEPSVEMERGNIENTFTSKNITIKGFYSADGQISIMPFHGSGSFTLYIKNAVFKVHIRFNLKNENALQYISRQKIDIQTELDLIVLHFENLFEGNPKLGEEVNKFLNQNWRKIFEEFGPGINGKILSIFEETFDKATTVPVQEVFLMN